MNFKTESQELSNCAAKSKTTSSVSTRLLIQFKRSKVKEIIVLIKARSFLDELNLEHLTS